MGIWIRTKNREQLIEIATLELFNTYQNTEIFGYSTIGIKELLGRYRTRERALEILDEIQKRLTQGEKRIIKV